MSGVPDFDTASPTDSASSSADLSFRLDWQYYVARSVSPDEQKQKNERFQTPYPARAPQCRFSSWEHARNDILIARERYVTFLKLDEARVDDGWQPHDDIIFGNPYQSYYLTESAVQALMPLTESATNYSSLEERRRFVLDLHFTIVCEMQQAVGIMHMTTNSPFSPNASGWALTAVRFSATQYRNTLRFAIYKLLPDISTALLMPDIYFVPELLATGFVPDDDNYFTANFPRSLFVTLELVTAFLLVSHHRAGDASAAAVLTPDMIETIIRIVLPTKDHAHGAPRLCQHQQLALLFQQNNAYRHLIESSAV